VFEAEDLKFSSPWVASISVSKRSRRLFDLFSPNAANMTAPPDDFSKRARMIWAALDDHIQASAPLENTVSILATPIEQDYTNGGHTDSGYVQGYKAGDVDDSPDICELYACILRYARTLSWKDKAVHLRLIKVLTALFARPDPPAPPGYEDATLWRGTWFGSEVRDEWNFHPGVCNMSHHWMLSRQCFVNSTFFPLPYPTFLN
jgi:hypothetical protein